MRRIVCILAILLLIPMPTSAVVYEPVSFVSSGVQVDVVIEANTPWISPFAENVNVTIGVTPLFSGITETNITRVSLVLHRLEADESGYFLITAEEESGTPLAEGVSYANYTQEFSLTGSAGGLECYFSVLVRGACSNATFIHSYQALGPENLVGPFVVSTGIASPVAWVGLIVIGVSSIVFVAGIYGVKKSRTRKRRRSLSDD